MDEPCNVLCEPPDIHATVLYGKDRMPTGVICSARKIHGHEDGPAWVLRCEPAVESPPPPDEDLQGVPAWLMTVRFL